MIINGFLGRADKLMRVLLISLVPAMLVSKYRPELQSVGTAFGHWYGNFTKSTGIASASELMGSYLVWSALMYGASFVLPPPYDRAFRVWVRVGIVGGCTWLMRGIKLVGRLGDQLMSDQIRPTELNRPDSVASEKKCDEQAETMPHLSSDKDMASSVEK